jgi:hypothetical protein
MGSAAFQERMEENKVLSHGVVDGTLLKKLPLTSAFLEGRHRGCNQLKMSCWNVRRLLECGGAVFAFHLMTIGGLVALTVFLVGLVRGAVLYLGLNLPFRALRFPLYPRVCVVVTVWLALSLLVAMISIYACVAPDVVTFIGTGNPVVWPGIGTPCQFSGGPVSVKPAFGRVVTAKIVVGLS